MARRTLSFDNLDAAVADARHLMVAGYTRAGNWSLGQVCGHLALWVRYPLDGFPHMSVPVRAVLWGLRNSIGKAKKVEYLAGIMPAGKPTLPMTVPPADADDVAGVTEYEAAVERLKKLTDTPHPSPLLGPVTRDELERLTCVHAAHHLSFLIPPDAAPGPA